jgi:predicted ester cyclase
MAYDVMYEDASWPTHMHGHTDVRAFLESTWRAVPDLSFAHENTVLVDPSGTKTARYWTGAGTHTGVLDPPGLNPTGRQFQFRGASFLEIHDRKLRRIRVVYDHADVMRQLSVLPARSSAGERLIMMAANPRTRLRRR